jgi:hypothetical protein
VSEDDAPNGSDEGARTDALERKRRRRRRVLVPLVFVLPLVLLLGGAYVWWRIQLDPPGSPGAKVTVTVAKGWGVRDIAKELSRRKVIGSSFAFNAYVRIDHHGPFSAGEYNLRRHLGVKAAVRTLERGPVINYVTLAVPPGLWLSEVATQVEKQMPGLSAKKFLAIARSDDVRSKYEPKDIHTVEGLLVSLHEGRPRNRRRPHDGQALRRGGRLDRARHDQGPRADALRSDRRRVHGAGRGATRG